MGRLISIFCLFILTNKLLFAQQERKDAMLWQNIYLEKKISKIYAVHLNQQNRWNNNMSNYRQGYVDFGITKKINKNFKVMVDYVYIWRKNKFNSYTNRHQYYMAFILSKKFNKWKVANRLMFQGQNNQFYYSSDNIPRLSIRNKGTIKYSLNKYYTFYMAHEYFLPVNDNRIKKVDRFRSFAGVFYSLGKKHELELYAAYQRTLNQPRINRQNLILGVGYSVNI